MKLNKSIVIASVIKNGGNRFKKNLYKIAKLQKYFLDFQILIYENNSTDNTKKILSTAEEDFPFVKTFCFTYSKEELDKIAPVQQQPRMIPCGIQLISYGRNYLKNIISCDYSHYDYTLVIDLDCSYFNPKYILKLIKKYSNKEFSVITANGLTRKLFYRDAYAYRTKEFLFGPEFFGEDWWNNDRKKIQKRYFGKNLIPVYSAFGGAGIYKTKEYITSTYSALPNNQYLEFLNSITDKLPTLMENTGYTAPVVCEHVPFHFDMILNGHDKIFIDPKWKILFI